MSDELKDFRYYADKAEAANAKAKDYSDHNMNKDYLQYYLRTADMYAELAKAAPKPEPKRGWLMRDND